MYLGITRKAICGHGFRRFRALLIIWVIKPHTFLRREWVALHHAVIIRMLKRQTSPSKWTVADRRTRPRVHRDPEPRLGAKPTKRRRRSRLGQRLIPRKLSSRPLTLRKKHARGLGAIEFDKSLDQ